MIDASVDAASGVIDAISGIDATETAELVGGGAPGKVDPNSPDQLRVDAEETVQVSVVALPFKHFLRGLMPKWDKFTYFNDELSSLPENIHIHAKHYYAYRHSLLVVGVFLQLVPVILEWIRWKECDFNAGYIGDSKCDPIPDLYRSTKDNQQKLLLDLYAMLRRLSFIEPISSTLAWLLLFAAALKWRKVAFSKKLVIFAFILKFVTPFVLQVIPFRSLIDFEGEFVGALYNANESSENFLEACEGDCSNNDDYWSLSKVCKVSQKDKAVWLSEFELDIDSTDADDKQNIKQTKALADSLCQNVFRTPCDQMITESSNVERLALNCDRISDYAVFYWDAFAGGVFSALTMKLLAPAAMGLIPGIAKGATVVKFLMPSSALVGYVMMLKPILYTPMFIAFSIAMFQAIGDVWFALAIVFLTLAQAGPAAFGQKLTNPLTLGQTKKVAGRVGLLTMVCALLALVFFVLSFVTRTDYFDRLNELGLPAASMNIQPMEMVTILVSVLANMYIAKVTFVDVVMHVLVQVHDKERDMIAELAKSGVRDAREDLSMLLSMDQKASASVAPKVPQSVA